uniref:Ig-like domain-containing protein n=1 Tax=Amazona collaria TaxID=241587 RepID=A0A8B9GHZ6_9PSIT
MLLSLISRSWGFVFFSKTCIFSQNKLTDIFTGPDGSYFVWKKNEQKMKACITEQFYMLFDGRVHVLSWVKDSVSENTEYKCSFISEAGNTTSEKILHLYMWPPVLHSDGWTKEFHTWRSAISEHDKMMQSWRKTWVRISRNFPQCFLHGTLQS